MRGFVIGWLFAFSLVGLVALGLGWSLGGSVTAPPTPVPTRVVRSPDGFTQADGVEVVAQRFPATPRGERYRRELRQAARVTYHSPGHWTVRWDAASWTAHWSGLAGDSDGRAGPYAEPDNDAARQREAEAASAS